MNKYRRKWLRKLNKGTFKHHKYDIKATVKDIKLGYVYNHPNLRQLYVSFSRIAVKGRVVARHAIVNYTNNLRKLGILKKGDVITLKAGLSKHITNRQQYFYCYFGLHNISEQYKYIEPKLSYPTKIRLQKTKNTKRSKAIIPKSNGSNALQISWYIVNINNDKNHYDEDIKDSWDYYNALYPAWSKSVNKKNFNVRKWSKFYNAHQRRERKRKYRRNNDIEVKMQKYLSKH